MFLLKKNQPKVEILKEDKRDEKITKLDVYEKSILIMGSIGVGKTMLANKLHYSTNLPVIEFELLKHCPRQEEMLASKKHTIEYFLNKFLTQVNNSPLGKNDVMYKSVEHLLNEYEICKKQIAMREILPKLPNFESMGYNSNIASIMKSKFGDIAWHYYEKQFEIKMLDSLLRLVKTPIILDLSASATVSLVEAYAAPTQKLFKHSFIKDNCDISKLSFKLIERAVDDYKNIVYLKVVSPPTLPTSVINFNERLLHVDNQYERLATQIVNADGLRTSASTFNQKQLVAVTDFLTSEWKRNNQAFVLPVGEWQKYLP